MYMLRAYQSPNMGTLCGPQWLQMPNLASRNHSGALYWRRDSKVGSKVFNMAVILSISLFARQASVKEASCALPAPW